METSLFTYQYPEELVAQHPLPRREDSRMIVLNRQTDSWLHQGFSDFTQYIREGDLLILNNAEADLVERDGKKIPPLPPYIRRIDPSDFTEEDFQRYRTVYASVPGSKAAPTAGFHLTEEILGRLAQKGTEIKFLTLHVNYDTFKPIRSQKLDQHPMHGEEYLIPPETIEAVIKAKAEKRRVVAVGTTVVRALESWAGIAPLPWLQRPPVLPPLNLRRGDPVSEKSLGGRYETSLFITPGFQFQIVDALLTNFHRPRSTVLVMVSAFAGREFILSAYKEVVHQGYRLFSYGDCMLIL
ncbi:MAG: S-adenosylmethionine:tRNA ribosyltransferase-isomerase [Deltaproteobacteria bacterium]|nr:S-adenosylmethionine:tRNA ribosyltransferase-isomerase [Deltaproteobacteria bacterium]